MCTVLVQNLTARPIKSSNQCYYIMYKTHTLLLQVEVKEAIERDRESDAFVVLFDAYCYKHKLSARLNKSCKPGVGTVLCCSKLFFEVVWIGYYEPRFPSSDYFSLFRWERELRRTLGCYRPYRSFWYMLERYLFMLADM